MVAETWRQIAEKTKLIVTVDEAARERDRRLDERLDKLVSAMGEFIRRQAGNGKPSA